MFCVAPPAVASDDVYRQVGVMSSRDVSVARYSTFRPGLKWVFDEERRESETRLSGCLNAIWC
jgi:hypothetical protein